MNKQELISGMSEKTNMSKKDIGAALEAFMDIVTEELKNKGKVQLVGFGTFETTERAARTGRNPKTGEAIEIGAYTSPKFKAGKALKDAINA